MVAAIRTVSGTRVYVSASAPATFDEAGFAALTWTEAEGFDSIGTVGNNDTVQSFNSLADGILKYRGTRDPGEFTTNPADIPDDPGQIIMKAANDAARGSAGERISLRVEEENGIGVYCQVMVAGFARTWGGGDDLVVRNVVMPVMAGTIVEFV